ncbi:CYTH domain-containing protein [Thalassobacillus devorans]|uniref:CYTH domain-containing protein n=1 Tax=Thalassobacillus devorans TaxID=279813 RepID=UPI000A1CDF3B|nr:CYTH domain-containing protein [Thalassobacillus devorans]
MNQEIEIEFKNILTKEEYDRLKNTLPFEKAKVQEQTNHYFETENFDLKQNGAALRIREKNGGFTLTLKQPHPDGLLETHATLTTDECESWISGAPNAKENVFHQLHELGINPDELNYQGALKTNRQEIRYQDTLLVLDHSLYHETEDYELELEATDRAHGEKVFHQLLTDHEIPERETDNKIKRFFQARP